MIAPLFFSALACLTLAVGAGRRPGPWLALVLTGTACALLTALHILGNAETWVWRASFTLGGEAPGFFLDGVAAVFLVLVSLVGASSAVYAREYWSDRHYPTSAAQGRAWAAVLLLGMALMAKTSQASRKCRPLARLGTSTMPRSRTAAQARPCAADVG